MNKSVDAFFVMDVRLLDVEFDESSSITLNIAIELLLSAPSLSSL